MEKEIKINPNEWYTLTDIVQSKMFPWATSFWSIRRLVVLDSKKKNILKANIRGEGRGTKYYFLGVNIIKFIDEFKSGKIKL